MRTSISCSRKYDTLSYENFLVGHSELQVEFLSHLVLTGHSDVVMGVIITNRDDIYEKFKFLQNGELIQINPFVLNIHFLYPLKTSENLTVFCCFQGVEKGCIRNKWVNLKKIYLLQRLWSMLLLLLLLYYDLLSWLNSTPNRKK